MLLMEMLKTNAPSGCEDEMRDLILNEVKDMEHFVDSMGNVIVHKKGNGKRVMISAHMDEVGFIVSKITDSGEIKFKTERISEPRTLHKTEYENTSYINEQIDLLYKTEKLISTYHSKNNI